MSWGISENATSKEKLKSEMTDFLNDLNSTGTISLTTYDEMFDFSMKLLNKMYDLGKLETNNLDTGEKLARNYVIVCNRYKGIGGSLQFWGHKTKDNEKRSFGGYTSDFNACEKYTLEELEKRNDYKFPIYGRELHHDNWREAEDFIINVSRLKALGYRPMMIYYR